MKKDISYVSLPVGFLLLIIILSVISIALVGCSQEPILPKSEEVINNHGDIQNLDGLDRFIKNVEN